MFDLPQSDITQLLQAAKVYGVEDLCINGYAQEYSICVRDKKNNTSNVFSLPLKKVVFDQSPREEGGPKPMIESMACGVPLVTTNVGMADDFIRDKINGGIIDSFDPNELAKKSMEILNLKNLIIRK